MSVYLNINVKEYSYISQVIIDKLNLFVPCWQIEGTYRKLDNFDKSVQIHPSVRCAGFIKYGNVKPIELNLFERGIDNSFKFLEKATLN